MKKSLQILMVTMLASASLLHTDQPHRPCCSYENGRWYVGGRDVTWWDRYYPGSWQRFGIGTSWDGKTTFTDVSEQPDISGFERSVYTSPK